MCCAHISMFVSNDACVGVHQFPMYSVVTDLFLRSTMQTATCADAFSLHGDLGLGYSFLRRRKDAIKTAFDILSRASTIACSRYCVALSLPLISSPSFRATVLMDSCGTPTDPPGYVEVASIDDLPEQTHRVPPTRGVAPSQRGRGVWHKEKVVGVRAVHHKVNRPETHHA